MADEERIEYDDPQDRVEGLERIYGPTPTRYEAITQGARDHANRATPDASNTGWMPLGPRNVGGAVRCIAQHPNNPNIFIAGSAGSGVWRSTNNGYTWRSVGGNALFGAVGSIAYAPSDPRIVYAGSGELSYGYPGGIGFFRSNDGGDTFTRMVRDTGDTGSAGNYARIVVDPADASRAWIASTQGLFRLENNTFNAEALPGAAAGQPVTDVALTRHPANANQYVILAAVSGVGVAQGIFNRNNRTTAWTVVGPGAPAPWAGGIGAVKVAWSTGAGLRAYAVVEQQSGGPTNGFPSVLYRSTDLGATWLAVAAPGQMEAQSGIAWYTLTLAVNPANNLHVVGGCVNLNDTTTVAAWRTVLNWVQYDAGDRAQHADQNMVLFDSRGGNAVWIANDGGISFCPDITAAVPVWRKRSYGIGAAQLFDLTTHRLFANIFGGGMQDNGTFVSYGGPTWYRLAGGDGGALAFHPTSPFRFYTSWQGGSDRVDVSQFPPPGPPPPPPPPQNSATLPDVAPPANVHAPFSFGMLGIPAPGNFFMRALASHPTNADFVMLGGLNSLQYANDGANFTAANLPGVPGDITAVEFDPAGVDMWAGSTTGRLFVNNAALPASGGGGVQPAWTAVGPIAPGAVTAIAVHPTNANIVAFATAGGPPGGLFLTHDRGATAPVSIRGAANALPNSPFLALAWDPTTETTLYVGTLSGVYVARDLPVSPLVPANVGNPTWQTFNAGLPLVPVTDLAVSPVTNTLRCATLARGAYECHLNGVTAAGFQIPAVGLLVRNHAADDGRVYLAANRLGGDPRIGTAAAPAAPPPLAAAGADAAGPIDVMHSPDIRVDSPRFTRSEAFAFGEAIDGSELDEVLVRDEPLVGDTNIVYVQVQNRGTTIATNVDVHLYFADAGNPAAAPNIPAAIGFPAPAPLTPWHHVDTITVGEIAPDTPAVVSFRWVPPITIRDNVTLLAAVTSAADLLASIPAGTVDAAVRTERRIAVHVTHVQRDTIFIRDGLDDSGDRGAVAWGGRSPDIIVRQAQVPAANIRAEFANLAARHEDNVVRPGVNFIYVRVTNRTQTAIPISNVRLFQIPRVRFSTAPGTPLPAPVPLTQVGPAAGIPINAIPAGDWGIAEFSFTPDPDPDPQSPAGGKGVIFLAMANVTDAAGVELDPFPDLQDIVDVTSFFRFFTGAPLATNAAMRALRFTP